MKFRSLFCPIYLEDARSVLIIKRASGHSSQFGLFIGLAHDVKFEGKARPFKTRRGVQVL